MLIHGLHGLRIIEDLNMTEPGSPVVAARTWKERLWSWPWRPWQPLKLVIPQVPCQHAIIHHRKGIAIMHPEMAAELKRLIKENNV